jgi:signal transduction histidine kinase
VLFNLLINAIQAVDVNGCIQIVTRKENHLEASFEVVDDGIGVPAENRQDIFRPYFTTREDGTGLGLAIVRQIALAHGWEVQCLPNNPKGARFRITRMELASTART